MKTTYKASQEEMFANAEKSICSAVLPKLMYMGTVGKIDLYKHCETRRYINVDANDNFYQYDGLMDEYNQIDEGQALSHVIPAPYQIKERGMKT